MIFFLLIFVTKSFLACPFPKIVLLAKICDKHEQLLPVKHEDFDFFGKINVSKDKLTLSKLKTIDTEQIGNQKGKKKKRKELNIRQKQSSTSKVVEEQI